MVERAGTDQEWFRGLRGTERQAMRSRAASLDGLSATGAPSSPVRLALFVGEGAEALTETATLAYELGAAGQIVWLYSPGELPKRVPADFHERVRHINPDPERPLVDQVPPADLFLTPDPGLLAAFYRAERTLLYWHRHGTVLPEGWAGLPARILATGTAGTTISGRRVFPVAPGPSGWMVALAAGLAVAAKDPFRARRPRLSLCMIVKNEEKHLQNCLLSVYGVVDEICIVDTGSTDRTVAIAERLGARVEHRAWRDDFAWARNESLAMATGDWVLHLDADEVLTPEAQAEVPKLICQPDHTGFLMLIESLIPGGRASSYAIRLFRRDQRIRFTGIIHENIGDRISLVGGKVSLASGRIRHFGYTEHPMLATGKRSRNRGLLLKGLESEPNNQWYAYYLAVEEYVVGAPAEAIRLLEKVEYTRNWLEGEPALLRIHAHRLMGEERKALVAARAGTRAFPRSSILWIAQVQGAYGLNEPEPLQEALAWLADPTVERLGDQELLEIHAHYLLGCMATDPEQRERHLLKSAVIPKGARTLFRHWLRTEGVAGTLARMKSLEIPSKFDRLLQAMSDLQDWPSLQMLVEMQPELRYVSGAGSLFLAQGRPEEALACWQSNGSEGWLRYATMLAFMGGTKLLAVAEPHLNPLEWLAVQDMAKNEPTWRWAVLVPTICDINNPTLIEQLLARAPYLSEAVTSHLRINVLP